MGDSHCLGTICQITMTGTVGIATGDLVDIRCIATLSLFVIDSSGVANTGV